MTRQVSKNNSDVFVFDSRPVTEQVHDFSNVFGKSEAAGTQTDDAVLDVGKAKLCDSLGIIFLVGVCKALKSQKRTVKLEGASDELRELLKLLKLDSGFFG